MLTELPDSLGSLTHLQKLQISGNRLTYLPASIGNLNRLEVCLSMTLSPLIDTGSKWYQAYQHLYQMLLRKKL